MKKHISQLNNYKTSDYPEGFRETQVIELENLINDTIVILEISQGVGKTFWQQRI